MTRNPRSNSTTGLGESWVIEDESYEDDDDDDGGTEPSESTSNTSVVDHQERLDPEPQQSRRGPGPESRATVVRSTPDLRHSAQFDPRMSRSATLTPTTRAARASTTSRSAGPELIMPSIHEDSSAAPASLQRRKAATRQAKGKATGTDGRQAKEREPAEQAVQDRLVGTFDGIESVLRAILGWGLDIVSTALRILKTPISYLLAIYLLVGIGMFARNLLTRSIYSALSPVCRVPGVSFLDLGICKSPVAVSYGGDKAPPAEFDQLMAAQASFEEILTESAGGVSLPLDMKRGEASIRDLRTVVRYSGLRSKNELVLEFDGFIDTARMASYDLQKFNSHIGRSVDNVLATTRWTQRMLDGINEREAQRGALEVFFTDRLLAPFQPLRFTEDVLLGQYVQHTRIVEDEILRLLSEAQALLAVLQSLEDRLDVIHAISARDGETAKLSRDEVLSQLWTMLGGNGGKLERFERQLRLLRQVNTYRQSAWAHVSGTILKLQAIGSELEELRERVGSAELLGDRKDVPLSVHIENVQMGVQRLEMGREGARQAQKEYLRKTLDSGEADRDVVHGKLIGD